MGFFSAPQAALASGRSIFYGELYEIGFTSGEKLYWDGFGNLVISGDTYVGAANIVARSEIPIGVNDENGQLTLSLSGVDADIVAAVRAEEAEIYGRPITIWGQFFSEALQPSGDRFFLYGGTMDVPTYSAEGPTLRSITIPCEGEWSDRNGAAFSFFSNSDQQRRYPGDKGLEYVYRYAQGVRRQWPNFE